MKTVPKLIRRFAGVLAVSVFLLLVLNLAAVCIIGRGHTAGDSPYRTADQAARALERDGDGYRLTGDWPEVLRREGIWAVLIENESRRVVWHTDDLPREVPLEYSLGDIANFTLGYVADYPTYAGAAEAGLLVLGYPKDRFWKLVRPTWDLGFIADLPKTALYVLLANLALVLCIYLAVNGRLLRTVRPIVTGIQALATGEQVALPERGLLSEVAANLNRTSRTLCTQARRLKMRDTARANWIAGVSHDIRTPLSMVMGYADQLERDPALPELQRKKAAVILRQSRRIGDLVSDLNLAARLEYEMQPAALRRENAVAVVREAAVELLNTGLEAQYSLQWLTAEDLTCCPVEADRELLKRAVYNLIQNSVRHNPGGCTVYVTVEAENGRCVIRVEDDGTGASGETLAALNAPPGEAAYPDSHGLGLRIVKQIAAVHGGTAAVSRSRFGGFAVELRLPAAKT